ncbi:isopenicillin-N N-acyltransferase [Capronia epimyces CBS 606.96]|uniref:Isopenicillin-N N-acyltransferase n=1 Tax=Capronia epimyces CBS 606.96 TaxID=1182542 RepID=W9XKK6_9EURO|nr:isopenicillin-N N-acyltransferase [Capronia epimyces CBS 606.96]EXJ80753.1 isopenicillin-N N-acyltransferase [Capronia epimyces CBS 606.96]
MTATAPTPPLHIHLSGTPQEIGRQHGTLLATQIRRQIVVYEAMFQRTSKLDWPAVRTVAETYQATLQRLTPDLYAEMEGIANGAGLDLRDIVALNCRSEIALGLFSDGCSSLGWDCNRYDKGVILAQNWDWTARVKENCVIMTIEQVGKPKIWMGNEAGLVGKIGFNSASVGVCMNAIRAKPTDSSKLPFHVAVRLCLNATSAAAAIAQLQALGGIASTQHILIADPTGPVSMELSPLGNVYIRPKGNTGKDNTGNDNTTKDDTGKDDTGKEDDDEDDFGIVCHTNHLISNRFVTEYPWLTGSPVRLARMRMLSAKLAHDVLKAGPKHEVTGDMLRREVFSDTFNAPQAICCQEDPARPVETRSSTLFCFIMRLRPGRKPEAEVVWGRPGSGEEGPVINLG